jgi:hypothetical protein
MLSVNEQHIVALARDCMRFRHWQLEPLDPRLDCSLSHFEIVARAEAPFQMLSTFSFGLALPARARGKRGRKPRGPRADIA